MVLVKILAACVVFSLSLAIGGCNKPPENTQRKQPAAPSVHGPSVTPSATAQEEGLATELKKKKLAKFPSATIGTAFEEYPNFTKREWRQTNVATGKIIVDFTGWLDKSAAQAISNKEGLTAIGIQVKFVVEPDGSFFVGMVSKVGVNANGQAVVVPVEDSTYVLKSIYAKGVISL